jgi:hypothetical protein
MQFTITITHERKKIRLNVEVLKKERFREVYRVVAKNQWFILENNRPFLEYKGLKHFPATWTVTEGGYNNKYLLDQITKAIEDKI